MSLTHKPAGLKILEKIKIYILSRAKLLCSLCHEIPCSKREFDSVKIQSELFFENFVASAEYMNFNRIISFIAYLITILKLRFSEKPKIVGGRFSDFVDFSEQNIITLKALPPNNPGGWIRTTTFTSQDGLLAGLGFLGVHGDCNNGRLEQYSHWYTGLQRF